MYIVCCCNRYVLCYCSFPPIILSCSAPVVQFVIVSTTAVSCALPPIVPGHGIGNRCESFSLACGPVLFLCDNSP